MGRRRRRIYERKFDWAEARARYAAGETQAAIAKSYGVNQSAVGRVVNLPEYLVQKATSEQMDALGDFRRDQVPCPRCERPKLRASELCWKCFNETRLNEELRIMIVPGRSRVQLGDVAAGRIVRVGTRWGVVMRGRHKAPARQRIVDFWDGGRSLVSDITVVAVAPGKRIFLGGVEERPEEIAA